MLCSSSAGDCEVLSHISNEHSPHSRNALACLDGVKQLLYLNSYYLNSYVFSSEEAVFLCEKVGAYSLGNLPQSGLLGYFVC